MGARVHRLRRRLGLSQADLAGDGLSASFVSLIESDRRVPSPATVKRIAQQLGTTAAYLETGVGERSETQTALDLNVAQMALRNGDPHLALDRYLVLAADVDRPGFRPQLRAALIGVARAHERLGDLRAAVTVLEKLRSDCRPEDSEPSWATVLVDLARCYRESGDRVSACRIAEDGMKIFDALGNPGGAAEIDLANTLIGTYYESGDWLRASVLADATMRRAQDSGNLIARAGTYWCASQLAQSLGDIGLALEYSERAVALYAETDSERNLAMASISRAWILLEQDHSNPAAALAILRPVEARLEADGDDGPLAYCRTEIALALVHNGEYDEALVMATLAAENFRAAGSDENRARALLVEAQALALGGKADRAPAVLATVEGLLAGLQGTRPLAALWTTLAEELVRLGRTERAMAAYSRAAQAAGIKAPPSPRARRGAVPREAAHRSTTAGTHRG